MSDEEIQKLATLAREATPGPWWRPNPNDIGIESENFEIAQTMGLYEREYERMEANAAYIAAANPTAILALIEEVTSLRAAVAMVKAT